MKIIHQNNNYRVELHPASSLEEQEVQYKVLNLEHNSYDFQCESEIQALIAAEQYNLAKETGDWNMQHMLAHSGTKETDRGLN